MKNKIFLLIGAVTLQTIFFCQAQPELLSISSDKPTGIAFDTDGHNVLVTWADGKRHVSPVRIYTAVSTDGGKTFTRSRSVPESELGGWFQALNPYPLITDDNMFHLIWTPYSDKHSPRYTQSGDHGRNWVKPIEIGGSKQPKRTAVSVQVVPGKKELRAYFLDQGMNGLFVSHTENGTEWQAREVTRFNSRSGKISNFITDHTGTDMMLAYLDTKKYPEGLFLLQVNSNGSLKNITPMEKDGLKFRDSITEKSLSFFQNRLSAVYAGNNEITYAVSEDFGKNWSKTKLEESLGNVISVKLVESEDIIIIVWNVSQHKSPEQIRYAFSSDGGQHWSVPQFLLPSLYRQREFDINLTKGILYVAYIEDDIPCFIKIDGGKLSDIH